MAESEGMAEIRLEGVSKVFPVSSSGGRACARAMKAAFDMMEAGASKEEVKARTGCTVALRDVTLTLAGAETYIVMGVSGSGKSTLVRLINRLIAPSRGRVCVDGKDLAHFAAEDLRVLRRHKISMVFQGFALFPHLNVLDNVAYGLRVQGVTAPVRRERAMNWIEAVGLRGYERTHPAALSGGMRQRVGLARALATSPDILLMDEPFSALDPLTRQEMQDLLIRLRRDLSVTIVFITHDFDEALRLGHHVCVLQDGRVEQVGSVSDLVLRPATDRIRRFVESAHWQRWVTAKNVMNKGAPSDSGEGEKGGLVVSQEDTIEEILNLMGRSADLISVKDESGKIVGTLNPMALGGLGS